MLQWWWKRQYTSELRLNTGVTVPGRMGAIGELCTTASPVPAINHKQMRMWRWQTRGYITSTVGDRASVLAYRLRGSHRRDNGKGGHPKPGTHMTRTLRKLTQVHVRIPPMPQLTRPDARKETPNRRYPVCPCRLRRHVRRNVYLVRAKICPCNAAAPVNSLQTQKTERYPLDPL